VTPEQINELKQKVTQEMNRRLQRFIGESLNDASVHAIKAHLRVVLLDFLEMGEHPVLDELEVMVGHNEKDRNALMVSFQPKTERAMRFLLGQEMW
jgi:hypothetical protein